MSETAESSFIENNNNIVENGKKICYNKLNIWKRRNIMNPKKLVIIVSLITAITLVGCGSNKTAGDISSANTKNRDNTASTQTQSRLVISIPDDIKNKLTVPDDDNTSSKEENTSQEDSSVKEENPLKRNDSSNENADTAQMSSETDENTEAPYEPFDGMAYYLDDGQKKYYLDTKDGFKLHCFFQEGSPDYVEDIYTINLDTAAYPQNRLIVFDVTDGRGNDISFQFKSFIFTFEGDHVVMDVERDETTLAGGPTGSIMSGSYTLS